jgi:hypothetical protein
MQSIKQLIELSIILVALSICFTSAATNRRPARFHVGRRPVPFPNIVHTLNHRAIPRRRLQATTPDPRRLRSPLSPDSSARAKLSRQISQHATPTPDGASPVPWSATARGERERERERERQPGAADPAVSSYDVRSNTEKGLSGILPRYSCKEGRRRTPIRIPL